MSRKALWIP